MEIDNNNPNKTWAYGKAETGWYVAHSTWNEKYADHLRSLGYEVRQSIKKPDGKILDS